MPASGVEAAQQLFQQFAEQDASGVSPLYEQLALEIARDGEVAALATGALDGPPDRGSAPALLLAAAQRVLFTEPWHPLTRYYPSVAGADGPDSGLWPLFREFVLQRAERVRELVATRSIRTDEVRRAAVLYPVLQLVAKQAGAPLGLLVAGAGAGLLLGVDRYGYRYALPGGAEVVRGKRTAKVVLDCPVTGDGFAALGAKAPAIGFKIGLDRVPVDVLDEEQLTWLEACIWPDQPKRLRSLRMAADQAQRDQPQVVAADPVAGLAEAAAQVPAEMPLVVVSSNLLGGWPVPQREAFVHALAAVAAERPLWWVSQEAYRDCVDLLLPGREELGQSEAGRSGSQHTVLSLARWKAGQREVTPLAKAGPHGQWLEWL